MLDCSVSDNDISSLPSFVFISFVICFTFSTLLLKQNPLPYLARYPKADVLTSSDQVVPTVVDDRLEIWQEGED